MSFKNGYRRKAERFLWAERRCVDLDIFQRLAHIIAFPDVESVMPFTGKALFLAGADSAFVKAGAIKALFPYATLSVIVNAGHWLHVQQPGIFVERVGQFLQ